MSHFTTPLGQQLANPGTGEPFSTAVVNGDLIILENGVIADRARLTTIEGWSAGRPGANGFADYKVADLAALAATSATAGDTARVTALGGCLFRCTGGTSWVQEGVAITADAATRTTEYAKAAGAYLVQGAKSARADFGGIIERYYALYNSGTNPFGSKAAAGWFPTSEKSVYSKLVATGAPTVPATSEQVITWASIESASLAGTWVVGSPTRLVLPILGYWEIDAQVVVGGNSSNSIWAYLKKNGAKIDQGSVTAPGNTGVWDPSSHVVGTVEVTATTDYLELAYRVSSLTGAPALTGVACYFKAKYLGPLSA